MGPKLEPEGCDPKDWLNIVRLWYNGGEGTQYMAKTRTARVKLQPEQEKLWPKIQFKVRENMT